MSPRRKLAFCYITPREAVATKQRRTFKDIREAPAYTFAEAARYLDVPSPTVRAWVVGFDYPDQHFKALIHRPDSEDKRLSFNNLVEIHVLRGLRTRHGVSMPAVRSALDYAEREYGIRRLLIHRDLKASAGQLFLDKYSELIELSRGGQLMLRAMLEDHLERVVYDLRDVPTKLFLWLPLPSETPKKTIVLDPQVGFGTPVTARKGVSTAVLASRYDAGETLEELAADYELNSDEVEDAIEFERAA